MIKKERINLFLKPENKAKLNLIAYSRNKTASETVDEFVENYELDLSKFDKLRKK